MRRWQKTAGFLKAALRSQIVPRARITARPPKDPLSPAMQAFGLIVISTAILAGPAWFFTYLEDYKNASKD